MDRHRSRSRHRSQARALHPGLERRSLPVSGHRRGRLDARAEPCRGGRSRRAGAWWCFVSAPETTTIFFDRVSFADIPVPVASVSLAPPSSGNVGRIQWGEFVAALSTALHQPVTGVPPVEDRAYIRELLQLA